MARTVAGAAPGRTNRKFLVVAVLFGALTAALFYALTARGSNSTGSGPATAGDVQVVVAKVPIKQRTTITAEMLEVKSIPANAVTGGAFTAAADAIGKVTKYPIETNQQVVSSAVVDTARPVADAALSLVIPNGRRAMSIQTSQVSNAGGLILPGDYVDLVWLCCKDKTVVTKTLLRNVQVAAIAQSLISSGPVGSASTPASGSDAPVAADASKPLPDAATMTLILTPVESQQLFLAEQTGTLRAVLRNVGDQDLAEPPPSSFLDIAPVDLLKSLPDALKPEGFKQ